MQKTNKQKLFWSSALILLPILIGLLLWNQLPDRLPTHWGADGIADGQMERLMGIVIPPLLMLAFHWLCALLTIRDPGNRNQSAKVFTMVFWIFPVLSLTSSAVIYYTALGGSFHFDRVLLLLIGLGFLLMGNWLPKCRRNKTIGIKVKWALENDENWAATHRLGGRVWVIGGLLTMACAFFPEQVIPWLMLALLLVMALVPMLYSWLYYRRQLAAGTAQPTIISRRQRIVTLIFTGALLVFLAVFLFTGSVTIRYDQERFTVQASWWSDLTVPYDAIESVEYREDVAVGSRTNGFGSCKLQLGTFCNEEFGTYTRYCYTGTHACVVLRADGRTLILSGRDPEETQTIYQALSTR